MPAAVWDSGVCGSMKMIPPIPIQFHKVTKSQSSTNASFFTMHLDFKGISPTSLFSSCVTLKNLLSLSVPEMLILGNFKTLNIPCTNWLNYFQIFWIVW